VRLGTESYGFDVSGNLELTIEPDFACLMSFLVLIKTLLRRKARHQENGRFSSCCLYGK
jgi:hypothetical protein